MASPPSPKKLKMSSSSEPETRHEPGTAADPEKPPRYKRRKIAIFLAYCGFGYQGMQKNPGARTIESDLEEALFLSGAVPDSDRANPKRYDWARSARTDKGVSAVGQVASGKFYVDPPGFIDRLNSNLSDQIRVFGFKRVTASFSSKKFCDRRRYVYLLPVFALDPNSHPDRESVMASVGSGNELAKCIECSERGRKVAGVMGKQSRVSNEVGNLEIDMEEKEEPLVEEIRVSTDETKSGREFRYEETEKERFNRILGRYVGTHNFHNFTTRTKAEDPSATRYIISFAADRMVSLEGIEFVRCEVVGQSFMLHQIRKMIGLAVAMMRNCCPESLMETALKQDVNINVPTAPEVGLYLDECFFTSYNNKWKDSHEELSMEAYAEEAEEFKLKFIYSHIASMEHKEGAVALWLHSLNHRNYPDLRFQDTPDVEPAQVETFAANGGCVGAESVQAETSAGNKGCLDAEPARAETLATNGECVDAEPAQAETLSTNGKCVVSEPVQNLS